MNYEVDRVNDTAGEPSIAEMTKKAIDILSKNPKGFFLFVEGNGRHWIGFNLDLFVKTFTTFGKTKNCVCVSYYVTSNKRNFFNINC